MNNIRSTLAIVWRIAAPYFRSEDKFAGRLLLAAVISIELALVLINVLLNQWNNRFYNALQEKNWDGFVREIGFFCILATFYVALSVYQRYEQQGEDFVPRYLELLGAGGSRSPQELGEIVEALQEVWGSYRETPMF